MLMQQIKYFTAVVNCKSFTEAAEQCYITQSAISQQIKSLERELGVQLIQRGNRKFCLTPAGEFFYRNCLLLVEEFNRLKSETKQIGRLSGNLLRIGALSSYGGAELLDAASTLLAKYPELSLNLVSGTHDELCEMIARDEIDLAFNDQRNSITDEYGCRQLATAGAFIAVAPQSKLSRLVYAEPNMLRATPCILVAAPEQQSSEKRFFRLSLDMSDNFLYAASLEEAMYMVISNKGYLPMDMYSVNRTRYSGFIHCIPLYRNSRQLTKRYCVFWKRSRATDAMEEYVRVLESKFISTPINDFH